MITNQHKLNDKCVFCGNYKLSDDCLTLDELKQIRKVYKMEVEDIESKTIESKGFSLQDVDLEEVVPKQEIFNFLDKSMFLETPLKAKILKVQKSSYGKYSLTMECNGQQGIVNLNKQNVNFLRETFGFVPKTWLNRTVTVKGQNFDKVINGEQVSGVQLTFI